MMVLEQETEAEVAVLFKFLQANLKETDIFLSKEEMVPALEEEQVQVAELS